MGQVSIDQVEGVVEPEQPRSEPEGAHPPASTHPDRRQLQCELRAIRKREARLYAD